LGKRRIIRALGATAGGLLGAAFLPAGAAFADDYNFDPVGQETVTGLYGEAIEGAQDSPPALPGTVQGTQTFDYTDTTTGSTGTITGDESTLPGSVNTDEAILVTSATGTDHPPIGSVFDTYTFDGGGYQDIYSDLPSPTGDSISDTLVTPFGDVTIPTTFDAADIPIDDAGGVPLGDGVDFVPVAVSQVTTAIDGVPPVDMAIQGHQLFDVDNTTTSNQLGSFDADETTTADALGINTEAVLVTKDLGGNTVGTGAGDTPAVGSIFNTINLGGGDENFYSDLVSTTGGANVITDTLETPMGDFSLPTTFDTAQAENATAIDLPDGDDLDPVGTMDVTGINGVPPLDVGVQGTQIFDYTNADGTSGTLDADVTNTLSQSGSPTETVLVTSSTDPDLPQGSVIETVNFGDTGLENVYTDIASTTAGGDVITDVLVTPFGDVALPESLDAAAGLANDLFGI
jgi:hypothetical protein